MSFWRALLAGLVVVGLGVGLWTWLRPAPSDEDAVRAVVGSIVAGVEAGDVGDVMTHLSADFRGDTLDRDAVRSLLTAQFLRRGPIRVITGAISVSVTGDAATASFDALLAEHGQVWSDILPVNADGWHFDVALRREDAWRVTRASRTDLITP